MCFEMDIILTGTHLKNDSNQQGWLIELFAL